MRCLVSLTLSILASCGGAEATGNAPALFDAPAADVTAPPPASALPEIPDDAPTVVFVGDSISAGLHLAEHQAFPAVLQRSLAAQGSPFHLVNASESGRTSAGGVTALEWVMRSEPDVVVIALGGNDGLRGVDLAEVERNTRRMIDAARAGDATVLLLGVRLPPNYGDYGARFDEIHPRLARELDLAFVPYYMRDVGGVPELNLPDGLHPTAEGQERLASHVLPALRDVLRSTPER